jgi:hypothetical protein
MISTHLSDNSEFSSALSQREFRRISVHPIRSFLSYGSIKNTNALDDAFQLIL